MTIKELLHISKPPDRLGGIDAIWDEAFCFYNEHHEAQIKPRCHSDYLKVKRFIHSHFDFHLSYYTPGPSGLSQAAKDEIRQIFKEELASSLTETLPKDLIRR